MRKLMILAMVLAMILGLTPAYAADGSLKLTAEAPDSAGVMYVTLSLSGDITGDTMNENVIDRVFSDFCVGK